MSLAWVISCLQTTSHRIYSTWNLTAGLGSIQLLDAGSKARVGRKGISMDSTRKTKSVRGKELAMAPTQASSD